MKRIANALRKMSPVLFLLGMFCSNPVEKDVRWRTSVDVPITAAKKFYLGPQMDTLFFNKKQMLTKETYDTIRRAGLSDSIVKTIDTVMVIKNAYAQYDSVKKKQIPDTVGFSIPSHKATADTISEDSLEDKRFGSVFGPIPIPAGSSNSVSIPLTGNYSTTAITTPIVPIKVNKVYHIEFLDTTQSLVVTVTNNSSATFSSVQITLGSLGMTTISNLAPNEKSSALFNVGGKSIDSSINVGMVLMPAASGSFAGSNNLALDFSLEGLMASKVVVLDSLLAGFQRTFTNEYALTDTVNVDYIDVEKGFFIYSITNYTSLELLLSVTHRHLWRSDFCLSHNLPINPIGDLVGLTHLDSLVASNSEIKVRAAFPPSQTNTYSKQNISGNRLFPVWDSAMKKSVTLVDYQVNVGVYNRQVTLSATDSLLFTIKTTAFKFKELSGRSTEKYNRKGASTSIPVTLPWSKTVTDSLRYKFKLEKVLAQMKIQIDIPKGALIDTVLIHYEMSSINNPAIKTSEDAKLIHVMRDSLFQRDINITDVVNDYPDSVKVNVSLIIPVGTRITAVNDLTDPTDPFYNKYIGRMAIEAKVDYHLLAPLSWIVLDTVSMDLGGNRVDFGQGTGALDPFAKMTDRHANLSVQVTNATNVYLKLYALVATDSVRVSTLVDTINKGYITTNQFTDLIDHPTQSYVNLLGNGLLIPPRDSTKSVQNNIALSEQNLSRLLNAKKIGWRWLVRFLPKVSEGSIVTTPDALMNTDWIKLNSYIHIDGVSSIDSLVQ